MYRSLVPMIFSGSIYGIVRMPIGTVVAIALLAFLLPLSVVGQPRSVELLIEQAQEAGAEADLMRTVATRAQEAGMTPEQTVEALSPAVALAERDLPSTPVLNKTLEGVAKQVPPSRLTSIVQDVQINTERADAMVSSWLDRPDVRQLTAEEEPSRSARNELIERITEAQQQSVPADNIEQFLDHLPSAVDRPPVSVANVSIAVSVLPDLSGTAANPKINHELLAAALDAGYDRESIRQLPAALTSARHGSEQPAVAIARATALAIENEAPAATVLTNLLEGGLPGGGPPLDVGIGPLDRPPGQGKPPGKGGKPPGIGPSDLPVAAPLQNLLSGSSK